ncbi:MAG: hypothetical protein IJ906_07270 [Oscillospiraceae bacterium]|nr:hypothetical protein [Oscillospiraceae bacterium]
MKKTEKSGGIRQFPDTGARDLPFFFKKSEKTLDKRRPACYNKSII